MPIDSERFLLVCLLVLTYTRGEGHLGIRALLATCSHYVSRSVFVDWFFDGVLSAVVWIRRCFLVRVIKSGVYLDRSFIFNRR